MFKKYTEKARRVIFFARYEASQFGSKYIETEHLLLGLLREEKCFAAEILHECGLTLAAARETIASGEFLDQNAKPELAEARSRVIQDPFQRMLEHAEYLEFIDISNGLRVGLCRFLMRPTVPRVGEEVILGSRTFRVRDVVYAFQDLPPQTGAGDKRLTQIVVKVEPSGEPS